MLVILRVKNVTESIPNYFCYFRIILCGSNPSNIYIYISFLVCKMRFRDKLYE